MCVRHNPQQTPVKLVPIDIVVHECKYYFSSLWFRTKPNTPYLLSGQQTNEWNTRLRGQVSALILQGNIPVGSEFEKFIPLFHPKRRWLACVTGVVFTTLAIILALPSTLQAMVRMHLSSQQHTLVGSQRYQL